jgi:hypothetical protein
VDEPRDAAIDATVAVNRRVGCCPLTGRAARARDLPIGPDGVLDPLGELVEFAHAFLGLASVAQPVVAGGFAGCVLCPPLVFWALYLTFRTTLLILAFTVTADGLLTGGVAWATAARTVVGSATARSGPKIARDSGERGDSRLRGICKQWVDLGVAS